MQIIRYCLIFMMCLFLCACKQKDLILSNAQLFNVLLSNAVSGDKKAQDLLGWAYLHGAGTQYSLTYKNQDLPIPVAKDYNKAIYWLQKSANKNDRNAKFELCSIYAKPKIINEDANNTDIYGRTLVVSPAKAIQSCAILGSAGMDSLGYMYYKLNNFTMAAKWYGKAANLGYVYSQFSLGKMYLAGQGVQANYQKAFQLIDKSTLQDVKTSKFKDGFVYGSFLLSNPEATYLLATLYERGIGTERDHAKALHYYFLTAQTPDDLPNSDSQYSRLAFSQLAKFATQNDIQAAALVGSLGLYYGKCYSHYVFGYYQPPVCPLPMNQLRSLVTNAAKKGNPLAQFVMGRAILHEWGKSYFITSNPDNVKEATQWFIMSAKRGVLLSQISLCNQSPPPPEQNYAWCKLALANRQKFPKIYDEIVKTMRWASAKTTKDNLNILSWVKLNGNKLFEKYIKVYGGKIYELKEHPDEY